jgi:hypothetical protein
MKHLENFESYNESKSDMKKIKKEIKDKMSEIEKLELKHSDMKKPSAHGSVLKQQISKLKSEVKDLEKEINELENTSEDFSYEAEMEEEDPYQDGFDAAQIYNVRGVFTKNPYERGSEEHAQWERGHYDGSQQPKQELRSMYKKNPVT